MSSTNQAISEETFLIIKKARLANASALAKLTREFETNLQDHTDWFWKYPLENPREANHFLGQHDLERYVDSTFWASILDESIKLINDEMQIPVSWAAFGIDENSQPQGTAEMNLGLRHMVVFHTRPEKPQGFEFKYSISKPFIARRLKQLTSEQGKSRPSPSQQGIGLCVTQNRLSETIKQLHFIHVDSSGRRFEIEGGEDIPRSELETLSSTILGENELNSRLWDSYVQPFMPLTSSGNGVHCHLSATSLFHSLTNGDAHAAAHLVFGFGSCPRRDQAMLIYHAMQIVISGIPALYSSMTRLRQEASRLMKYEQMLQLLQPPLAELSHSIGNMQRHTQELRAVLYEPEEALFASYSVIEPLFRENNQIQFQKANLPIIQVKHSPHQYSLDDIPLVTARVACDIFGIGSRLDEAQDRNRVLAGAVGGLKEILAKDAYRSLAIDFDWLTTTILECGAKLKLIDILESCCSAKCNEDRRCAFAKVLTRIKACLFTPFKVDSLEWPQAALQLLVRHQVLRNSNLSIGGVPIPRDAAPITDKLPDATGASFPGSFANLLAFIRDFASGAAGVGARAIGVTYTSDTNSRKFSLIFDHPPTLNIANARNQANASIGILKNWRLEGANYGDLTGAIVRFANRLPGVGEDWTHVPFPKDDKALILLSHKANRREFQVSLSAKTLAISSSRQSV